MPAPTPEAVLIIDSEEPARRALEGALTRQGYAVQGSGDPEEALKIAGGKALHAIILSEKLAQLDAPPFLRRLSEGNVSAPVVVTGAAQTTTERIIETLRAGAVEFVRKPLQPAMFMDAVHRAVLIAKRRQNEQRLSGPAFPESVVPRKPAPLPPELSALADELKNGPFEVPAVPTIVSELRRAIPARTSLDDLAKLAQCDPSLSLELLKLANNPTYSRGTRTSDIKTAVGRVGVKQLTTLVESVHQRNCLFPAARPFRDLLSSLWRYGAATAIAMRVLAENLGPGSRVDPGVAYAAGLLRDIGAVFLIRLISEKAPLVEPSVTLLFVRQRHEAIGAQILSGFGLDAAIPQLGGSHHAQSAPTGSSLYWPLSAVAAELADATVPGGDVSRLLRRGAAFAASAVDTLHIGEGVLRKASDQVTVELGAISNLFA